MSYDLFMNPRNGDLSQDQFERYFSARDHYTVEGEEAWYGNEKTGVYFVFRYSRPESDDEASLPVAFNMNYFRPSFFVREAEPEVTAFISHFDMVVDDPQVGGMGTGNYNSSKFVTGWLQGNDFGVRAIMKSSPGEIPTLPAETLEFVWNWNSQAEERQADVEEDVFVPSIMILEYQGNTATACVWPDAIPSIIPPVDLLIIGRKQLAPRRFFRKKEDMAVGKWDDVVLLLEKYCSRRDGEAYCLSYETIPPAIQTYVRGLEPVPMSDLTGLPVDQVLDREIVNKAKEV